MPPTPSQAITNYRPGLAGSFEEFNLEQDRLGFIGTLVAPVIETEVVAGDFGKIPIEEQLKEIRTNRAPGGDYAKTQSKFEKATFACEEHGVASPVDDRSRIMYSRFFSADRMAVSRARDVVLRNLERRIAALIFNASTWTGAALTTAITHEWDDAANAVPMTDIEGAVQKVWDNSGLRPNALIIGWKAFRNLRLVESIQELIKSSGHQDPKPGKISTGDLAALFALDHVLVGGSVRNSANAGQAASLAGIWNPEYAMVAKVAETDDPTESCVARIFHWGEDGSSIGGTADQYRDEARRSDMFRARMDVDEVVMHTVAGHLLSNVATI